MLQYSTVVPKTEIAIIFILLDIDKISQFLTYGK